jgi:hypothetical protein
LAVEDPADSQSGDLLLAKGQLQTLHCQRSKRLGPIRPRAVLAVILSAQKKYVSLLTRKMRKGNRQNKQLL